MTDNPTGHPLNRHLFIADNLNLLRRLDNETVHLVCIDPPFAKSQTFIGEMKPALSDEERREEAAQLASWGIASRREAEREGIEWPDSGRGKAQYSDVWSWEKDVPEDWVRGFEADYPQVASLVETARVVHSESHAAYLTYMAVRLVEIRRVLKPTGSLFIHCDATADSYLRLLLDAIFGKDNFRNGIAWCYTGPSNVKRWFPRKHDTILFYAKSKQAFFDRDAVRIPYSENFTKRRGYTEGETGITAGYSTGRTAEEVAEEFGSGKVAEDWWADIPAGGQIPKWELTGYPTQKPVKLAERIIKAVTRPGEVVLDCFAGCAYVPVAAELNGRQWFACDISPRAMTVVKRQFNKFRLSVDGEQVIDRPLLIPDADITVVAPNRLPARTDQDPPTAPPAPLKPPGKFKLPSSDIPDQLMREFLLKLSGWRCWTCGFANTLETSHGLVRDESADNFALDHIIPKSQDGSHQLPNRAAVCTACNSRKAGRNISLREFREENAREGRLRVPSIDNLIDLGWAENEALEYFVSYRMGQE